MTDGVQPDSIGSRIGSGLAWKAGSQVMLQISRMVVALILARLLAPHDWGLALEVLVVSGRQGDRCAFVLICHHRSQSSTVTSG